MDDTINKLLDKGIELENKIGTPAMIGLLLIGVVLIFRFITK